MRGEGGAKLQDNIHTRDIEEYVCGPYLNYNF